MISVRSGFVVLGCVLVGFVTSAGSGLVARAAEPPRWVQRAIAASDSTTVPVGGEAQRRIAQLEQRLKELEAERRGASASGGPTRGNASDELDAVIARNRELMARNRTLTVENQALAQSHLFEPPVTATACEPPPGDADPKAQLRYWAERLRDGDSGLRDRLTIAQNTALNVLLRRERELDPRNPWRDM
jgi:hypothetical protein